MASKILLFCNKTNGKAKQNFKFNITNRKKEIKKVMPKNNSFPISNKKKKIRGAKIKT